MLSNKDRIALGRITKALEENARADKGKAAKALISEREVWEKAAGGVKKLAEADKIRAEADEIYQQRVDQADGDSFRIIADAQISVKAAFLTIDTENKKLDKLRSDLDKRENILAEQARAGDDALTIVMQREIAAGDLDEDIRRREADLERRENAVAQREREVEERTRRFRDALA